MAALDEVTKQANDRNFRRGAIMGLTIAESFVLLVFCLLLLFAFWQLNTQREISALRETHTDPELVRVAAELRSSGTLDAVLQMQASGIDIADLGANGTLSALMELQAAGIDIRDLSGFAEAEQYWRFISEPELRRLMAGAVQLEDPQLKVLADAVEVPPVLARLDSLQNQTVADAVDTLSAFSEEKRQAFVEAATEERLDALRALEEAGLEPGRAGFSEATALAGSVIEDPALLDLISSLQALPTESREALARLATGGANSDLSTSLQNLANAEATLRGISAALVASAEAEARLTSSLRSELGDFVASVNGQILDDGSIVLPEDVVFEQGRAEIRPSLKRFLEQACPPWLDLLRGSGLEIAAAEIQGHASREWRQGTPVDLAYRNNLQLSQERARNVLNYCLDQVSTEETAEWSRGHVVAVGYSSSRPVIVDGEIDDDLSRRVVFSIELDREQLLDDLERESTATLAQGLSAGDVVRGIPRVIDGDTIEINGISFRLFGIDAPEMGQVCTDENGNTFDCGLVAKEQMLTWAEGREISCEHQSLDRYFRSIATCRVDGQDLGGLMVDEGKAMAFREYSNRYITAEESAREGNVGFWAGSFTEPWAAR